jgi:hypothetical protein
MSPERTPELVERPARSRGWKAAAFLRGRGRWALRSTWGELGFAGVWLAVVSGIALAIPYDAQRPYDSVALLLLTNPAAAFFRNVHYWAGQLFLVLTLAHAWDHLSRWTESRVPRAMWWRVTASLPLAVFVMLSGFMLKGDGEAQQALRIVTTLLEQVPWVGRVVSVAVFGTEANRQILYVHHVATASLLTWLFVAEHARATWPRLVALVEAFIPIGLASLFLSPALHDGLDPVVKGPWYFLGLQELLHWSARPVLLVAAGAALVVLVAALPRVSDRAARAGKWVLVAALLVYAGLTVVGMAFRGPNWAWERFSPSTGLVAHGPGIWSAPGLETIVGKSVPVVLGRREGCLVCHEGMAGLSPAHRAEAVGCASCHSGNPFSLDRATAHAGLVLIPGNLSSASRACGTAQCHPSQVERVSGSLMATMAGIVAVDREVFGERGGGARTHVDALGRSGADTHLRQLCASCHLGASKTSLGPIGEASRGGGCNACHLQYGDEARAALARHQPLGGAGDSESGDLARTKAHPNVSISIERASCFGCHSRSGRISTNYEGWMEESSVEGQASVVERRGPASPSRLLEDGRRFTFVAADVHARNMECVDCHTSREVMGDGVSHARAHEAVRVACLDCHVPAGARAATVTFAQLDVESRRIAELRGRGGLGPGGAGTRPADRFLATADGAQPLMNTRVDELGVASLLAKSSGKLLPLKPPAASCTRGDGHARLSCVSCHAAWAPRCPQCHTAFDAAGRAVDLLDGTTVAGAWVETPGQFTAMPPSLGLRRIGPATPVREVVDTFIPGMVMTLDGSQLPGGSAGTAFRRLYARSFSHTVGKSRSCRSCHADPVALGYGEGALRYEREGQRGRWHFTPRTARGPDGLPADAWTGFLQDRAVGTSTRADVRPFSAEEQKRILTVGACLTCHEPAADGTGLQSCASATPGGRPPRAACNPMPKFPDALARASKQCLLPRW